MRRKLTLTEELNRMRGLMIYENGDYKNPIIKEVVETESKSFEEKVEFAPGWYTLKDNQKGVEWDIPEKLSEELSSTKQFLINDPTGYIVNVIIEAGESQIPNTDNTGALGSYPSNKVKPKYLSKKREETIKNYVQSVFDKWEEEGIVKTELSIDVREPIIGETPWVGQEFCPDDEKREKDPEGYLCTKRYKSGRDGKYSSLRDKYTDEQYVKVTIEVIKKPKDEETDKKDPCNLLDLEITVNVDNHNCNNAEFFLLANDVLLYNIEGGYTANGNNAVSAIDYMGYTLNPERVNPGYGKLHTKRYGDKGSIGGRRSDTFKVNSNQLDELIKSAEKGYINIWYICTFPDGGCHLDMPALTIKKGDEVIVKNKRPKSNSALILTLDSCANKMVKTTEDSAPDLSNWRQKYLKDRTGLSIPNEIEGEMDDKQKLLKQIAVIKNTWEKFKDKITGGVKEHYISDDEDFDFEEENKELVNNITTSWEDDTYTENWFRSLGNFIKKTPYTLKRKNDKLKLTGDLFTDKKSVASGMFEDLKQNIQDVYRDMDKVFDFNFSTDIDENSWGWKDNDEEVIAKNITTEKERFKF